jgi:hypothetical protein
LRRPELLALVLLASCRPSVEAPRPVSVVVAPQPDLAVDVITIAATTSDGGVRWEGLVVNREPVGLWDLSLELVALDDKGAELGRGSQSVICFRCGTNFLDEGYEAPAQGWVPAHKGRATQLRVTPRLVTRADGPTPDGPLDVVWDDRPPEGVQLDLVRKSCWSAGPGIGPSAGKMVFDCRIGVKNTGTAPVSRVQISFLLLGDGRQVVDRLEASGFSPPLEPGHARNISVGRGVNMAHDFRIELSLF